MGDEMTVEEKLAVAAELILDAPFGELQEVCVMTCFPTHVGGIASTDSLRGRTVTSRGRSSLMSKCSLAARPCSPIVCRSVLLFLMLLVYARTFPMDPFQPSCSPTDGHIIGIFLNRELSESTTIRDALQPKARSIGSPCPFFLSCGASSRPGPDFRTLLMSWMQTCAHW